MKTFFMLILAVIIAGPVMAQTSKEVSLQTRFKSLEQEIERLNTKFNEEQKWTKLRYETIKQSINSTNNLFYIFGGIGSLLAGMVLWRTFWSDQKMAKLQLNLVSTFQTHFGKMLTEQTNNIGSVGDVINLVHQTFEQRFKEIEKRDDKFEELTTMIKVLKNTVDGLTDSYTTRFENVKKLILPFENTSRMDWPRLSIEDAQTTKRARTLFDGIPASILEDLEKEDRYLVAKFLSILGTSAYYANDIEEAENYFTQGLELYAADTKQLTENSYPRAVCNYFLGLIAKNWRHNFTDEHLGNAKTFLMEAERLLKKIRPNSEYLTPISLAEVLTYIDSEREKARTQLDGIIKRLEDLEGNGTIDDNQSKLLSRTYLLQGNLDFLKKQFNAASIWYQKAVEHDKKNPFALLSNAQAMSKDDSNASNKWTEGLLLLESSNILEKRETTVQGWVLVWAVIASCKVDNSKKAKDYKRQLVELRGPDYGFSNKKNEPLFFDPVTKGLVPFEQLIINLDNYCKEIN